MTNKKLLQIVAIVVVAAALFTSIMAFGLQRIQKQRAEQPTQAPTVSTTTPTTTASTTTVPPVTIDGNRFGDAGDTTQPSAAPTAAPTSETAPASTTQAFAVPQNKNAVIRAYVNAVNALKAKTDFTLEKTETINVQIDEMNPSSMLSLANKIIDGNKKKEPVTYRFTGGSDAASGKSATFVIAPAGKNAALDPSLVTSATAAPAVGGGCVLTIKLGPETQTVSALPRKHSACMDVLTVDAMGLPSAARIDEMTVNYNNSSITATLDGQGRLTEMQHRLVVTDASANGSYVMSVSTRMHGDATAQYKISY